MNNHIVVLGHGPVGKATAELLASQGHQVIVAQRHRPEALSPEIAFMTCDALDALSLDRTLQSAAQVVVALGFPYDTAIWQDAWPRAMTNLLTVCAKRNLRMVFIDNLYMYGPQTTALKEIMPLTTMGGKPGVRALITKLWQEASVAGTVKVAALRAPDFYGPRVSQSHLGDASFGAMAKDKRPTLIAPPDTPHDFAYVPDIARAVGYLLRADDAAFGQAWHMPCAPTKTPREILQLARGTNSPVKVSALPLWSLPLIGTFIPFLRELKEMRFQFDRPYYVNAEKFTKHFDFTPTPFEIGAPATLASFKNSELRPTTPLQSAA
jgi:nucleoside-diphosphate-sugar epimerase